MNGENILIDTNIALYLLFGDTVVAEILDRKNVYVSFITELGLLGFAGITLQEHQRIENFLKDCIIIDYNESIKQATIKLKQINRIKLPDAIIGATSIYMNIPLISADSVFETIDDIQFIKYEKTNRIEQCTERTDLL
ncbi:MAG: type II toxin-antitoxin system VapC family toxin [Saprospiraceae bacterium]|nr:type II toxin-antitoxin system VapC family toxin [Saprospiraceae bacterium]